MPYSDNLTNTTLPFSALKVGEQSEKGACLLVVYKIDCTNYKSTYIG